jgi:hypothetical protein
MRGDVALNVCKVGRGIVSLMCWLRVFIAPNHLNSRWRKATKSAKSGGAPDRERYRFDAPPDCEQC